MADTHTWVGDMLAVAQVDTLTPGGTIEADDVFIATINGQTISAAAGGTTVADVTAAITAAWNASTQAEFAEITATDSTTHITLTADTAGESFEVTVSTTEAGGGAADAQTFVQATTTANEGPNVYSLGNFTVAGVRATALPANTDTVVYENSNVDCLDNLDQSGVTLALLVRRQSFTGKVGRPRINANGYAEYRDPYLKISATIADLGEGEGNGSPRFKLNTGSVQAALTVYNSGTTRAESGIPSDLWIGTHASNTVTVLKGDLGVCFFGDEVATIATLKTAYVANQANDASVICGAGTATLTTVTINGGVVVLTGNVTTLSQTAGTVMLTGSATVTTWIVDGGAARYNSSGTATTILVGGGGVLDFRQNQAARTVTNCSVYQGAAIHDPFKTVAWTNGIDLQRCGPTDVTLNLGEHQTLTPSSI